VETRHKDATDVGDLVPVLLPGPYEHWQRQGETLNRRTYAQGPQRSPAESSQILGLQTDLKLDGNQYANCLAIFFAFYIASEVPSNLVIKKVSPRIWLGVLTTVWGIIGMSMGFVKSYTGLMVVRAFLGAAEGGLLPGIVLYLSMMYRRKEIGIRLGLIYSSASLSGA
jgi:MFS family permease